MFELLSVSFLGKLAEFLLIITGGVVSGWLILRLAAWDSGEPGDPPGYWVPILFIGIPLGAFFIRNVVFELFF